MSDITVVTTFHQPGLELYAQRFLDSFALNVDKKIKLIAYAEDCNPENPDTDQITILDQKSNLRKLDRFKQKWSSEPKANGFPPDDIRKKRPRDWHKKFKWDAVRFSNKVYSVFEACKNHNQGWVVWIDADTYVHSKWSYNEFKDLLPESCWITYVGRGRGSQTWPECGFYGLNVKNSICQQFLNGFEKMYEDAENGIFKLDEWHDSYVFGYILNNMKEKYPDVHDYSSRLYLKQAKTGGGGHPLINTDLGKWIDHMKGDRKNSQRSKTSDIIINRTEEYWK